MEWGRHLSGLSRSNSMIGSISIHKQDPFTLLMTKLVVTSATAVETHTMAVTSLWLSHHKLAILLPSSSLNWLKIMFLTLSVTVTLCVMGKLARLLLQICVIIWTLATNKASVTVMDNASAMKAITEQTALLRLILLKLPQITTLCLTNHSLIKAGANGSTTRLQKILWTATRLKSSVTEPTSTY